MHKKTIKKTATRLTNRYTVAKHPQAAELRQWLLRYPTYKELKEIVKRA